MRTTPFVLVLSCLGRPACRGTDRPVEPPPPPTDTPTSPADPIVEPPPPSVGDATGRADAPPVAARPDAPPDGYARPVLPAPNRESGGSGGAGGGAAGTGGGAGGASNVPRHALVD